MQSNILTRCGRGPQECGHAARILCGHRAALTAHGRPVCPVLFLLDFCSKVETGRAVWGWEGPLPLRPGPSLVWENKVTTPWSVSGKCPWLT